MLSSVGLQEKVIIRSACYMLYTDSFIRAAAASQDAFFRLVALHLAPSLSPFMEFSKTGVGPRNKEWIWNQGESAQHHLCEKNSGMKLSAIDLAIQVDIQQGSISIPAFEGFIHLNCTSLESMPCSPSDVSNCIS